MGDNTKCVAIFAKMPESKRQEFQLFHNINCPKIIYRIKYTFAKYLRLIINKLKINILPYKSFKIKRHKNRFIQLFHNLLE